MGSENDVKEIKQVVEPVANDDCVVCFEPLATGVNERTLVTLRCSHQFHLDCIGSAFNCKNKMICPSCRKVEKGDWKYAAHPTFNLEHVLNDHLPIGWENGSILALPANSSAWRGRHVLPNDENHNIQNISNLPAMPTPPELRINFWVHDSASEARLESHEFNELFSQRRLNDLLQYGNGGSSVGTSNGRGTCNDGGASNEGEASNGRGTRNYGGASNDGGTSHGREEVDEEVMTVEEVGAGEAATTREP